MRLQRFVPASPRKPQALDAENEIDEREVAGERHVVRRVADVARAGNGPIEQPIAETFVVVRKAAFRCPRR